MTDDFKSVLLERSQNMRLNPTKSEKLFKERLELSHIGFKTQWVIGIYIVDFLIKNIIVEIDGSIHSNIKNILWDKDRDNYLKSKGYKVIRINNSDVSTFNLSKLKTKYPKSKKKIKTNQPKDIKSIKLFKTSNNINLSNIPDLPNIGDWKKLCTNDISTKKKK